MMKYQDELAADQAAMLSGVCDGEPEPRGGLSPDSHERLARAFRQLHADIETYQRIEERSRRRAVADSLPVAAAIAAIEGGRHAA